jgi:hypothetical protein
MFRITRKVQCSTFQRLSLSGVAFVHPLQGCIKFTPNRVAVYVGLSAPLSSRSFDLQDHAYTIFFVMKGPAADATDAPQPWGLLCNPVMKMISFFVFPCHWAPVEWNWQGKPEVLGEKPVPVTLCPTQIAHGLTRDRTRAAAVRGWRLTAWALARPYAYTISLD